jgi:hypothetical protein
MAATEGPGYCDRPLVIAPAVCVVSGQGKSVIGASWVS